MTVNRGKMKMNNQNHHMVDHKPCGIKYPLPQNKRPTISNFVVGAIVGVIIFVVIMGFLGERNE